MIYGDNDHGDMPVPQYALERELKEARCVIMDLRRRLNEIKKGYEGCCHACEPVGAENCRLRELLNHTPEDILMRNQQLAIENERLKGQLEDWKECFENLRIERDLLWKDLERVPQERQKQMMALDNLARLDEELGLLDPNNQTGILRRTDFPETGNLERTDDNGQS
jgi:regulator of replication initiation timing